MKKLRLFFVLIMCAMVMMSVCALAEGEGMNAPFDWAYLATIAGATAATLLIAQFLKFPLDRVWKIPTRVLVYVIALIIILVATFFTAGLTAESVMLAVINAFVVALAAYGSYELTFAKKDEAEK